MATRQYLELATKTGAGVPFYVRGHLENEAGAVWTSGDIRKVTYEIRRRDNYTGKYEEISGFEPKEIPPSACFIDHPEAWPTLGGATKNFEHIVPTLPSPFAVRGARYKLIYRIYPVTGEVSGFDVTVESV